MRLHAVMIGAVGTTLVAACGPAAPGGPPAACAVDPDCSKNRPFCVAGTCLPSVSPPASWRVEITPQPGSAAALTEQPFLPGAGMIFTAAAPTSVTVSLSYAATVFQPSSAELVLTVPAAIAGRPDRTFTATAIKGMATKVTGVPSPAVTAMSPATITVTPLPPDDATAPPRTFAIALTSPLALQIPNTDHSIGGQLLEADSTPPANPFIARAFIAGTATAVSNRGALHGNGSFSLVVPEAAWAMPLAVEIVPTGGADPTFTSSLLMLPPENRSADLGSILLPPYTSPNQFSVAVQDAAHAPLAGALVTASTVLSQVPAIGTSGFLAGTVTADTGVASLSLLPGTATTNLSYEIAVVPPLGAALAAHCAVQPVGTAPVLDAMQLPHRRVLAGTVRTASGARVPDVVVTATPGPGTITGCTRTRAAPGSATTDAEGHYALALDPATYQLDYDPPPASPFARVTNPNGVVTVTDAADATGGDVTLPTPGVVQGWVNAPPDGTTALEGATVRIYEPQCSASPCLPPALLGQGQTDATGQFRIVVASP